MEAIRKLMGGRQPPGYVEGDIIYPTHMMDNNESIYEFVMCWTLCFNDVLDADKVHAALAGLFEIGDWRKLGGRLRKGKGRNMELHVPQTFTNERPAVTYSHDVLDMNIDEHRLASKIPKPTPGAASYQDGYLDLIPLSGGPGAPEKIADFLDRDIPIFNLHIMSFNDGTLVSLRYPHAVTDGMGQANLLRAWSLVLAGRSDEVPPLLGAREDVIYEAGHPDSQPQAKYVLESYAMMGLTMLFFALRMLWDILWGQPMECRSMCIPKTTMDTLRAKMMSELAEKTPKGEEEPFISENDVMEGIFASSVARAGSKNRPLLMGTAMDLRNRIVEEKSGVFVGNVVLSVTALLSAAEAQKLSPADIALAFRTAVIEQTTKEQILGQLRITRREFDNSTANRPVMYGTPWHRLFFTTNWTRSRMFQAADFASAVLRPGDNRAERTNPPGQIYYHVSGVTARSMFTRNVAVVLGKDHAGNTWIGAFFQPRTWARIEKAFKV